MEPPTTSACHCGRDGHPRHSQNCPEHGYVLLPRGTYEGILDRLDQIQSLTEGTPRMPDRRIHAEMIGMIAALKIAVRLAQV